jgi:glycerophosphoryl diester phosphodiesterase
MHSPRDGIGEHGELVPGPPWILGHRGSPREAPENTLVSLRRAIDLGLDGIEYDLHACASGEPVLIHDELLDRTTDASGTVAELTLPELAGVDAGGWFAKKFVGEPLPLLEEALELPGNLAGTTPQHMIELKDPSLVGEVARQLRELHRPLSVRIASFHRSVCLEARDLGLPSMLLAIEADAGDHAFVRDERLAAYGTGPGGWRVPAGELDWDCERWSWSVDDPEDLLDACRSELFGFNTNEPVRALATRALHRLTPDDDGPYPLTVPTLEVPVREDEDDPGAPGSHGAWSGRWQVELALRNPFPFPVEVALALAVRGGAFEVEGLPVQVRLGPGERTALPCGLAGGSWSPGEDPVVFARFVWRSGPGRPEESLAFDHPVSRVRTVRVAQGTLRVPMLREHPGAPYASVSLRRRGEELIAWVEDPGGLGDVRALLRVGERVRSGGRGVRVPLPPGWRTTETGGGLPFSVGFEGRTSTGAPRELRRWAGGLPYGLGSGAPGCLFLEDRA